MDSEEDVADQEATMEDGVTVDEAEVVVAVAAVDVANERSGKREMTTNCLEFPERICGRADWIALHGTTCP